MDMTPPARAPSKCEQSQAKPNLLEVCELILNKINILYVPFNWALYFSKRGPDDRVTAV